jgi:aspartyl-tRNA(Asn)/glutamyl-tRNA(Gln) amidotransferase subunit A
LWRGGVHLAQSFDTLGWIFRDLRDAPLLAEGLFGLQVLRETDFRAPNFQAPPDLQVKIGAIAPEFLHDCDANVLAAFASCKQSLAASGADVQSFDAAYWDDALSIYAPIQASEAAAIHAAATGGDYSRFPAPPGCENLWHFPKAISERLAWGASLTAEEVQRQRQRHAEFRNRVDALFQSFDFLIMPCSPISKLEAGRDHTQTRPTILRYTTPLSLAGSPVVTLPFPNGAGIQLSAPRGQDSRLLTYAAALAT